MKILVKSVYDAFDYCMSHYYPFGLEEFAERTDRYAVISIQDSHLGGFGFSFTENDFCTGVLTLLFDDTVREIPGTVLFSEEQAEEIIDFILDHLDADTLLIHCYGGQSRSVAVAAFACMMLGLDNSSFFEKARPNEHVYSTLIKALEKRDAKASEEDNL